MRIFGEKSQPEFGPSLHLTFALSNYEETNERYVRSLLRDVLLREIKFAAPLMAV